MLEHVVRSQDSEPGLRGRAQWLIGETHYLQQDFAGGLSGSRFAAAVDAVDPDIDIQIQQAKRAQTIWIPTEGMRPVFRLPGIRADPFICWTGRDADIVKVKHRDDEFSFQVVDRTVDQ